MAKILLIDDDEALGAVFTATLTKSGFQSVFVTTGQAGLEKAKSEKPDLILLDQVLPDIQGNEVLKTLQSDSLTQNIPVIVLSNFSQAELVKEAINLGAKDYVFKYQAEPADVVNKIKETLKINESGQCGSQKIINRRYSETNGNFGPLNHSVKSKKRPWSYCF